MSAARWKILFERFLAPRMIAYFLRRAFRMREPRGRGRQGVMTVSEADRKRQHDREAYELERRIAVRRRRVNFNMVRESLRAGRWARAWVGGRAGVRQGGIWVGLRRDGGWV